MITEELFTTADPGPEPLRELDGCLEEACRCPKPLRRNKNKNLSKRRSKRVRPVEAESKETRCFEQGKAVDTLSPSLDG